LFACEFLEIAKYITCIFIPGWHNQVNMITHKAPAMYIQASFLLTMLQTIKHYITLNFSGKYINPPDRVIGTKTAKFIKWIASGLQILYPPTDI
jgi:hypothetical protein